MLIDFTVGNFLSFKEKKTLSFRASGISELQNHVVKVDSLKLLRTGVVYGANSSGKSNLIKALDRMRDLILGSVKLNDNDLLDYSPFLLSETNDEPTFFEVEFYMNPQIYRYGFEYNRDKIINEWLFSKIKTNKEVALFIRTEEGIAVSDAFIEGKEKESATNDNRLFISLVAQLNGELSKSIISWFKNCNVLSGIDHKDYTGFSINMLHEKVKGCDESLDLFQKLQLGFSDINIIEAPFDANKLSSNVPQALKEELSKKFKGETVLSLKTVHKIYNNKGDVIGKVLFDKKGQESEGTNKIIDLAGPIFDTLNLGKILIIDELDAKLHPLITMKIVQLFNDPDTNKNNAQLFFATHDTNLLSSELFRRDQIWFTEKDELEQTDLYSLIEFKLPDGTTVRKDNNYQKNYIRGRYGAIPFITYTN